MTSIDELSITLDLIRQERQADLEQYRQKVLQTPLHKKTKEGICWYPVKLKRDYIGTGERLIIEVERTHHLEQPHVFQSGKMVSVFSNADGTPNKNHVGGVINYVRDNTMIVTLNVDDLPDWIDSGHLGVDVMFDELSYREMEAAMKTVIKTDSGRLFELREVLLGYQPANFQSAINASTADGDALNDSQRAALHRLRNAQHVGIIHGPPGTGKTTTLVHAIRETVASEGQVLVCAPSNTAVDLLVEKLSEKGLNVLRIGHPARVTEQSLSKTLDARIATHDYYKDLKAMRKRMEQLRSTALKFKQNFGRAEKQQRRMQMQEVKALKADADVLEFYIINDLLQKSDVVACTLVGSSHYVLKGKRFKSVFIDEAGQSLEPACWIPLLKAERVIFAGDHHQLPPTIKSIQAARAGLTQTLFEKCIQRHPDAATMLQVQYRMHEAIMNFSSKYFYEDKLRAHPSVKHRLLHPDQKPFDFIDTAGCGFAEKQDPETLSRYNSEEAALLIRQLEQLIAFITPERWLAESITLGIITPYSAQVDRLNHLADASPLLEQVKPLVTINTVDAFQGQERDAIAISLVRSNEKSEIGFLGDIRRTNVALTRAKKKLIVVGDSATLTTHPFYMALLEYVQQNEFYKSAWEFIT